MPRSRRRHHGVPRRECETADEARRARSLVEFIEADATKLPLPSRSYTACISQEAFVHIVDKERLFAECHRVLEPGGTLAFTDWTAGERLEPSERERLRSTFAASGLSTVDGYRSALRDCGFGEVAVDDLSSQWVGVLRERLEMYRSLRDDTIARFGAAHYEAYADNYAFFVGLIEAGRLGGARLTSARLASQGRHGHHESPT